jgi:hypothetical protein
MAPAYKRLRDLSENVRYDPGFVATDAHRQDARKDAMAVDGATRSKVLKWLAAQPP